MRYYYTTKTAHEWILIQGWLISENTSDEVFNSRVFVTPMELSVHI